MSLLINKARSLINFGWLSGSAFGSRENRRFTYTGKVNFRAGRNTIALLSVAVGLPVSFIPSFYI